jgi:hypothetical protein
MTANQASQTGLGRGQDTGGAALLDPAVAELESLLRGLLAEHGELLCLAAEHRRAISKADSRALGACLVQQGRVAQRVAELERRRLSLMARLSDRLRPSAGPRAPGAGAQALVPDKLTVTSIARTLPEPMRTRLIGAAERLRDLLERLHREHLALKEAATALASHMEGVMRQVGRAFSHAGTYGRRGAVDGAVQVISGLDLRS